MINVKLFLGPLGFGISNYNQLDDNNATSLINFNTNKVIPLLKIRQTNDL